MLLDGENQCGDDLDDWFHFAFNIVVSVIQIVCSKDGYGPKLYGGHYGYGLGHYGYGLGGYYGGYYGKDGYGPKAYRYYRG